MSPAAGDALGEMKRYSLLVFGFRRLFPLLVGFSSLAFAFGGWACGDSPSDTEPPITLPDRDGGGNTGIDGGGGGACGPNVDTRSDPTNCGQCGNVCPSGAKSQPACTEGKCTLSCENGFGDCNGQPADGCEVDLSSTVAHCGACDHDCRTCDSTASPPTSCTLGACAVKTLATTPNEIRLLTIDEPRSRVTYADADGVTQVDRGGADGAFGVYGAPNTPGILMNGNNVLLIYPGTEQFSGIYSTFPGFVGPQIAAYARGEDVEAMALDNTGVYYASVKGNGVSRVVRCKDCSVPTELAPTENSLRAYGIALDDTTVFFGAGDMIRRVEKTAADLKTIAVGQAPRSLAVDATHVYWINEAPPNVFGEDAGAPAGEVVRVAKAGGQPEKILTGLTKPLFLSTTEKYLYITDAGSKTLIRLSKDGKQRLDLAKNISPSLGGLTVDSTCVWFGAGPDIRKIAR